MATTAGAPIALDENIEQVIDILMADKINLQTFMSNYEYLLRGRMPSVYEYLKEGGIGIPPIPTPSVKQVWGSPAFRVPAVPLWFYAAFPDVMVWFDSEKQEIVRKHEGDRDAEIKELNNLFGVNLKTISDVKNFKEVLDKEGGQWPPKFLGQLVAKYKEETGRHRLEVDGDNL